MEYNILYYLRCWNIYLDVKYEENIIYQNVLSFYIISRSFLFREIFSKHTFAFEIKLILLCVCVINKSFLYKRQ